MRSIFPHRLLCALFVAGVATSAQAVPPANDDITNATVISALPFTDAQASVADATASPSDPVLPCKIGSVAAGTQTVWYRLTTGSAPSYVNIDTRDSTYDTILGVFTGSPGALRLAPGGCNDDARAAPFGAALFGVRLLPTTTYYIVVARNSAGAAAGLALSVTAAPVYTVTRLDDPAPSGCVVGDCSLREAIDAANATPGAVLLGAGTHVLSRSGAGENVNATGDLDLRAGMGLYGVGATGTGNTVITNTFASADRAFHVDPLQGGRMSVAFGDLAISGFGGATFASDGGAVLVDGASATFYAAFASFDRVVMSGNRSGAGNGGAIRARARGLLRDSTLSANTAISGGAVYLGGDTLSVFSIENSTLSANVQSGNGGAGGAIYAGSPLWLFNSTLSSNRADASGGALSINAQASGVGFARAGTKAAERPPRDGRDPDAATVALQDGVSLFGNTIARNTADFDANGVGHGGGVLFAVAGEARLRNNVIGDNVDANPTAPAPDCAVAATPSVASGYNLVEDAGSCSFFVGTGDTIGGDAGLAAALADNGGVTLTHLPQAGSLAIDTGDPAGCRDAAGVPFEHDQRESPYVRASGATCDRGAVEVQPQPAIPPTTPDLRAADDSGASNGDNVTSVAQPTFLGTCATGDTIEILVDGVEITPSMTCTSSIYSIVPDAPLTEGTHEIRARATLGPSTALSGILPIRIDLTAPTTTISSGPTGVVSETTATFVFAADEAATFECRLDTGTFVACTSPRVYADLQLGAHTFAVRATDIAGLTEVAPPTRAWTIRIAQTVTFAAINDRVIGDAPFTVSPTASSGLAVALESLTPTVCEVTTPAPGTVTLLDIGTCSIRAFQAGDAVFAPAEVTRTFVVRPPAPGVPDLAAASDTGVSNTDNVTRAATLTFTGTCVDGDDVELLVNGGTIGAPVTCDQGAYSLAAAVPEGSQQVSVRATRGGTNSIASGAITVVVDRTAPAAPVITGPTGSNSLTVTITGTGENGATVSVEQASSPLCTSAPVAGGTWSCDATFASNGVQTVRATQSDVAGNTSVLSPTFDIDVGAQVFANGFE